MKIKVLGNQLEWLKYCLTDLEKYESYHLFNTLFPSKNPIISILLRIHYSYKLNKLVEIPFKHLWYPYLYKCITNNDEDSTLFVFYDHNKLAYDAEFLEYLKKRNKENKIIYIFTNIVKLSGANEYNFVDKLNRYYDKVYAFDEGDSRKYGFDWIPLLYSYNNVSCEKSKKSIFFAGGGKDKARFDYLIGIHEQAKKIGVETDFTILGIENNSMKYQNEISYNKPISYPEVLRRTQEACCVVEARQKDSEAFTIKICEAIYYNKIFITTNPKIVNEPYYDSRYMFFCEKPSDLKKEWFDIEHIQYRDDAVFYYSIDRFINKLVNDIQINKEILK